MKADWLSDARKIPDEVMNYLRPIAVRAVEEKHYSPELIADILGMSRSRIYDWLRWYRDTGEAALDTRLAPGAPAVITPVMDGWLKQTVLNSTPVDHGYDTVLWNRSILGVCRTSRKNDPCDTKKDFISGSWGLFLPKSGGFYRFIPQFRPSRRKDASN